MLTDVTKYQETQRKYMSVLYNKPQFCAGYSTREHTAVARQKIVSEHVADTSRGCMLLKDWSPILSRVVG